MHDDKVGEMDSEISKIENIRQANKCFQNAEDTQTIIMHMVSPIELELQVFKRKYNTLENQFKVG